MVENRENIKFKPNNEKGGKRLNRFSARKGGNTFNRKKLDNTTVAVRYRHVRQACSQTIFRNIEKKGEKKRFFSFITPETEERLAVEVVTPIVKKQNRMLKRLPVEINILFAGKEIKRWSRRIYWKNDGKAFMNDLFAQVGRAVRLIHTEKILGENKEAPELLGTDYKSQYFKYANGTQRKVRRALLDV